MNETIPVLMVAPELAPWKTGGVAILIQKLASAVAATDRVRLTVLGTVAKGCQPGPPDYHPSIGFELIEKPRAPEPFYHLLLQLRYRAGLREWLRRNPGGVIHFGILPGARTLLAAAAAVRCGAPRVTTMVDWPPLENHYHRHPQAHWAHWQLARILLGRFPLLLANSHFIAKQVRKAYPAAEVTVIPNGICPEEWDPQEPPALLEGSPRFLYWGLLWRKKGVDILLKALALLRERGFPDARLYIVGEGEEEEALKSLCRKLALELVVEFLGRVEQARLRSLVHASDVAVFPSVYEGFGIAILEAMVCGKATVTTAHGGPREFMSDGKDGILVGEWDAASLAGALERIARSKTLAQVIGRNARETALRYTWQAIAPRYVDLYARLSRDASKG